MQALHLPLIALGKGDWESPNRLEKTNPWDGSDVGSVPVMNSDEANKVLEWGAAAVPTLARWPIDQRVVALRAWADAVETNAEDLATTETMEMGKTIRQSRPGILAQAARIRAFCDQLETGRGTSERWRSGAGTMPMRILDRREPLGLAVGFLPFNSPVAALVWKTAPALLMGNPVVVKLSSQAPLAALKAAHLLYQSGLPDGAVQVIAGPGPELSQVLASHPAVRKISFTGGTEAGTILWRSSAEIMARLTLECGSNDPALILDDAEIELAARIVVEYGINFYNGQLCTAPKRCLVSSKVEDEFVEAVNANAKAVVSGNPLLESTQLGPLVSEAAAIQVEKEVAAGTAAGAQLLTGGKRGSGAMFDPTVLGGVNRHNPLFLDGPFGPVLSIIRFEDDGEAATLANTSPYGLRAAIFSRSEDRALAVAQMLDFGGVSINGPATVGEPTISVDPRKLSGVGSEGIETSLAEFSQLKQIWHTNPSGSA